MAKVLTAAAARMLKPEATRREIADAGCPGLYLVIQPSGKKSWAVRYRRPDGQPAKLTLGPYADRGAPGEPVLGRPLSLVDARVMATAALRQRAHGQDPGAQRRQEKRATAPAAAGTFAAAAARFVREHAQPKTRRWQETARLLGFDSSADLAIIPGGLADRWRDKPLASVTADDVHALVRETGQRGAPGAKRKTAGPVESRARAMYATLSKAFAWLVAERVLKASAVIGVARPPAPAARDRVLNDAEVKALWRACDVIGPPGGPLAQLLLLTGCRRDEVREMMRSELDGATWTIPGSRTKNHREHILPLPPLALDLLSRVPRIAPDHYVFTLSGTAALGNMADVKLRLDAIMKSELPTLPPWRLHDLRRTAATGLARAGVDLVVIEKIS